jgi:hypothetical protein
MKGFRSYFKLVTCLCTWGNTIKISFHQSQPGIAVTFASPVYRTCQRHLGSEPSPLITSLPFSHCPSPSVSYRSYLTDDVKMDADCLWRCVDSSVAIKTHNWGPENEHQIEKPNVYSHLVSALTFIFAVFSQFPIAFIVWLLLWV